MCLTTSTATVSNPTIAGPSSFAQQPELQSYFHGVMQRHGITEHIRFSTTVLGATWDDATATWSVTVRGPDGSEDTLVARAVIGAVGQLNVPFIPTFDGAESFAGKQFHTDRWDHDLDLTGKSVVMIGAGASGFQVVPTIADKVSQLTGFQRTAQ